MRIYRYRRNFPAAVGPGSITPAAEDVQLAVAVGRSQPVHLAGAWARSRYRGDPPFDAFVSLAGFIEAGPTIWEQVEEVVVENENPEVIVDLDEPDIQLLCPMDRCASLRDFLAFEDHVKRGARRRKGKVPDYWYEAPVYYKGNHRQWIGPDSECPWPPYTKELDFELELAMIVGRPGRDIKESDASEHIFGFSILNDFSARDVQMQEVTAWLGPAKGKDFANALGPCVVTADEIGAEPDLEMICRVNGEEWGRGRSSDARWSWAEMIAYVSTAEDIYPTDVYGSGTPGGCCGLDLGRDLAPGDVVELQIENIGVLRNVIAPRRD